MAFKIYNSLSRTTEEFQPVHDGKVGMYACGITVYDNAHIGHARNYIATDILYRLLIELYGKENVTYVRNITDVDDKINKRATERGISIQELTNDTIKAMHADFSYVGLLQPNIEPRATEHIAEMIEIIEELIKKGHAYVADGHVLFDTSSYPDYGKLSGRSLDEMVAGARVEVAPYKKNPMDFVLWKPSLDIDDESSKFNSPWSVGRPGWHIECSAMSHKYLGENFDIHCGGNDLKFPHHENEIAQSRCAFCDSIFAKYWFHVGFLLINGVKMSKSLHNFITIKDLREKGINGIALRYAFLKNNYRTPFDFSMDLIIEAEKNLKELHRVVENVEADKKLDAKFLEYLCDDLNTSKALAELHALKKNPKALKKAMEFLAIYDANFNIANKELKGITEDEVLKLIEKRKKAKELKDYKKADEIRNQLEENGVVLSDEKDGVSWHVK